MKGAIITMTAALMLTAGCDAMIGSTGQDTSFEREGLLDCAGENIASQDYVQGTATNPVRCGPQTQRASE